MYKCRIMIPWNSSTIPWNPSGISAVHPPSMDSTWNNLGRVKYCYFSPFPPPSFASDHSLPPPLLLTKPFNFATNSTCLKQFWWSEYIFLSYEYGMVISVYGMVIAMMWYKWYGMIWPYHGMVYGMVWYGMVWYEWYGIWYGMNGMVWYCCTTVWYVIWYGICYGMVWMVWYGMNGMAWYGHTMLWYYIAMVWYDSTSGMI